MAANDGEHAIREIFPGISVPDSTGAPGSAGDRSSPGAVTISGQSGVPNVGVVMPLASMADPGTDTTTQPGQTSPSVILAADAADLVSTGAGSGNANPNPHPNGG